MTEQQQPQIPGHYRHGTVKDYVPASQTGWIEPDDKSCRVKFFRKAVKNPEHPPAPGIRVAFDAPVPPVGAKKGKLPVVEAAAVILLNPPTHAVGAIAPARPSRVQRGEFRYPVGGWMREGLPDSVSPNPSLLLDKLIGWPKFRVKKGKREEKDLSSTDWWFEEMAKSGSLYKTTAGEEKYLRGFLRDDFIQSYNKSCNVAIGWAAFLGRWKNMLNSLSPPAVTRTLRTEWRLAVHLGRTSILENTGIALHRMHGIPIIPGQGLKGLAAAYATGVARGAGKISDPDIKAIFGTRDQVGEIIFLDAVPASVPPEIEMDMLNPHYPDWYSHGVAPADDQNPRPVYFLTVGSNSDFLFAVAPRRAAGGPLATKALDVLTEALANLGAGAKTMEGYGFFVV